MKKLVKTNYINGIKEAFESGMQELQTACELYVQAIDEDPAWKESIHAELEHIIPKAAWAGMEQAGRGVIDRRLTFNRGGKNAKYLKRLQLSDQKRILDGDKVKLLTTKGDTLLVNPLSINKEQAEQLFDGSVIRSPEEQRVYKDAVERNWEMVEKTVEVVESYRIERGRLIIPRGCVMSKQDVMRIALEMNQ